MSRIDRNDNVFFSYNVLIKPYYSNKNDIYEKAEHKSELLWPFLTFVTFIDLCDLHCPLWFHWPLWPSLTFVTFIDLCDLHWILWYSFTFVTFIDLCNLHWPSDFIDLLTYLVICLRRSYSILIFWFFITLVFIKNFVKIYW